MSHGILEDNPLNIPFRCERTGCDREPTGILVCEKTGMYVFCEDDLREAIVVELDADHTIRTFEVREFRVANALNIQDKYRRGVRHSEGYARR